jgi:hypothetical protein
MAQIADWVLKPSVKCALFPLPRKNVATSARARGRILYKKPRFVSRRDGARAGRARRAWQRIRSPVNSAGRKFSRKAVERPYATPELRQTTTWSPWFASEIC